MIHGLMAFFASLGFAILFNVQKKYLFYAASSGTIGGIIYYLILESNISEVFALFIASVAITIVSEVFARKLKCPATTFLICALIPLVPGGAMYNTVLKIVEGDNLMALSYGLSTIFNACAIVIGCTLVSSISKTYNKLIKSK